MDEVKFSPNKRYVKFNKLIGSGSMKRVYQEKANRHKQKIAFKKKVNTNT